MADQLPCSDWQLEREYLADLLRAGELAPLEADERLEATDLAYPLHAKLLRAVVQAHGEGGANPVAVGAILAPDREALELAKALGDGPPAQPWLNSARVDRLRALANQRRARDEGLRAAASAEAAELEDAREHALALVQHVDGSAVAHTETAAEVVEQACSELFQGRAQPAPSIGFPLLDPAVGGIRKRTMTVLGGVTGSGKSGVSLAAALNLCARGHRVGIVSTEDSQEVWGPRILSHLIGVGASDFEGAITRDLADRCHVGVERARALGLHFAFALNAPLSRTLAGIRQLVQRDHCTTIIVDYVQAISVPGENRHVAISRAAQQIKGLCQSLDVALILCSQLSRPRKDAPFREPYASDLKESGDLENMAEVVILLWKDSDEDDARTIGKVAKVKWSARRPRFQLVRHSQTGHVVDLAHYERQQARVGRFEE